MSATSEAVSGARGASSAQASSSSVERKPPSSADAAAASSVPPQQQAAPLSSASKSAEKERPSSPTSAGSRLWSSWISPSSSASAAASSAFEARRKRRPTFEEFRAEEPPQARLIRLRGLFDVLLDKDDEQALAGGRAKEEWTRRAMQARYGAGGAFARGSLAPPNSQGSTAFGMAPDERAAAGVAANPSTSPSQAASGSSSSSSSRSAAKEASPGVIMAPRQSYAKELLSQCRECRAELERERAREAAKEDGSGGSSGWTSWLPWGGSAEPEPEPAPAGITSKLADMLSLASSSTTNSKEDATDAAKRKADEEAASSGSSLLSSISSIFSSADSTPSSTDLGSDHEGEAGWVGSGVWGLSAVGATQRQADRERDNRVATGEEVEDDGGRRQRQIEWEGFLRYAESKERELYKIFSELDKNGDMHLDVSEIRTALDRAGIEIPDPALADFVASIASSSRHQGPGPAWITFPQFRDYLLLLPRKPSVNEIYRFYQVRKAFGLFGAKGIFASFSEHWGRTERHGATTVNLDGDVSLAGEERSKKSVSASKPAVSDEERERKATTAAASASQDTLSSAGSSSSASSSTSSNSQTLQHADEEEEEEEDDSDMIHGAVAVKFLLAGGIAGAVSRTATAPFDRLKIYLITTARQSATSEALTKGLGATTNIDATAKLATKGASMMGEAIRAIYRDGRGVKAFWVGNGLNCVKIFPESAIKFLSYEMSKRAFAKYVDNVSDSRDISGTSRFISGGIGGITSQLAIYPVETLKTRLMSSQGTGKAVAGVARLEGNALVLATARDMWRNGGIRTYYRGLTAGLIGVFPYSAIDMSTFEGIKLFWIKYTGREEPSVLSLLAFGSISGSVGATTVYPLNLVRTRLQAAGTPAHPQTYDGFADVVRATYKSEGVSGFYRGLVPTLAKVVPAVSISYVVYEHSKRHLGVQ